MIHRCLVLLFVALLPQSSRGHFFWAETDQMDNHVDVTFSEKAGVPDKVISIMEGRVTKVIYITEPTNIVDVNVALNEDKTVLEGDLPQSEGGPAMVAGYLDFGPFMNFKDLEYSFGAQIYRSEADYDEFFVPLLQKSDKPLIVMRNCGGNKGTSYQFAVGGFPQEGTLGVCIYQKGGFEIGCGDFHSHQLEEDMETTSVVGRALRRGNVPKNLSIEISPAVLEEIQQDDNDYTNPTIFYAIANKTIADEASTDVSIAFASTSVYFGGPCKQ